MQMIAIEPQKRVTSSDSLIPGEDTGYWQSLTKKEKYCIIGTIVCLVALSILATSAIIESSQHNSSHPEGNSTVILNNASSFSHMVDYLQEVGKRQISHISYNQSFKNISRLVG